MESGNSNYPENTHWRTLGKRAHLNPVVVLTDIAKSAQFLKYYKTDSHDIVESQAQVSEKPHGRDHPKNDESLEKFSECKTPSKSKRKRKASWDPAVEYEVKRILGHHQDAKTRKILYRVSWKNYKRTTLEPIENLTSCVVLLMNYLENGRKPSEANISKKHKELRDMLMEQISMNQRKMMLSNLELFQSLDIRKIFTRNNLHELETSIRTEYRYILRCIVAMADVQDPGLIKRGLDYLLYIKLIKLRKQQLVLLSETEKKINILEKVPIVVENAVDLEEFPSMIYTIEMVLGDLVLPEPVVGCDCEEGCSSKSYCCGEMAKFSFAYDSVGRYRFDEKIGIYECNSKCKCDKTCPNRVVQKGRRFKLAIFKTVNCGWGVKSLENIPKGSFVCEYLGELIPEADLKENVNPLFGYSYIFDLDFDEENTKLYCIDATKYGNVSRFINHSCDPNLTVLPVWIDCLAGNLHRLAFFAVKDIQKGEEITFDYEGNESGSTNDESRNEVTKGQLKCLCGHAKCREWLFKF